MALAAASKRFLTPATGRSSPSLPYCFKSRLRSICNSTSASGDTLLQKLLQLSTSQIKRSLDSEGAAAFVCCDSLVARLASSSPQKAKLNGDWRDCLKTGKYHSHHYSSLISLSATIRDVALEMSTFTCMEACGIHPTTSVFNSLIHTCLSLNDVMTSLSLFEVMESSERFRPDSETYDTFILGFSNLRDINKMRAWYQAKRDAGFSANLRNYESLIFFCVKVKDFSSVDLFYEEMMALGVVPSLKVLDCVLDGLCKRRNCERVKEFVKFMLECRFVVNGTLVDKVVKLYSELEKTDEMEELLQTLMEFNQDGEALLQVHCGTIRLYAISVPEGAPRSCRERFCPRRRWSETLVSESPPIA